jgi:hypothetical protein
MNSDRYTAKEFENFVLCGEFDGCSKTKSQKLPDESKSLKALLPGEPHDHDQSNIR